MRSLIRSLILRGSKAMRVGHKNVDEPNKSVLVRGEVGSTPAHNKLIPGSWGKATG